jgi:hypothetical protein
MAEKPNVDELLQRFAGAEDEFLSRQFLAPAVCGGVVRVRIGSVVCRIRVVPAQFEGWGVFQPVATTEARLVRQAGLGERRQYLDLLPLVRLIVCRRAGRTWYGTAASFGDARIRLEGLAPIALADEVQRFDVVVARYDGALFWFDELDGRHDPAAAAYLRAALSDRLEPGDLARPGLTAEQRAAYELCFVEANRPATAEPPERGPERNPPHRRRGRRDPQRPHATPSDDAVIQRLRQGLSHAGAQLVDYLERADSFRVTYRVGRRTYTSAVDKQDLTVQVAGICLSGEDRKFDLASLVGVLREGELDGSVVPVGEAYDGLREEDYWRVHPPRNS